MSAEQQNASIVIVDDTPENLSLLNGILSSVYRVKAATRGLTALKIIEIEKPDLILLDIMMPEMDGYEVCKRLKSRPESKDIPIIFVTAKGDINDETYGLSLGAVDYIHKPIHPAILLARVKTHLALHDQATHLENLVSERTKELNQANQLLELAWQQINNSRLEIIHRLGRAAEFKDNETGLHVIRMSHYARLLAQKINKNKEYVELIFNAAPMHDIGKIGIPDNILLKPSSLDDHEYEQMQRHPKIGADILQSGHEGVLGMAYTVAISHHEKWDGSGYPNGLKAEEIPLSGRIVAIADVFDALTSERPYKKAWSVDSAIELLINEKGKHFDPALVDAFIDIMPEVIEIKQRHNENSLIDSSQHRAQ